MIPLRRSYARASAFVVMTLTIFGAASSRSLATSAPLAPHSPISSHAVDQTLAIDAKEPAEDLSSELSMIPLGAFDDGPSLRKAGRLRAPSAGPDSRLSTEVEPNDTAVTATPIPAAAARIRANVYRNGDVDYYSFAAVAGDQVYAATMTAFSTGDNNSVLDLVASDGSTVIETDNDDGTFSPLSSSIAGATIPSTGTYYLRVADSVATAQIRSYDLYFQLRSGAPVAEVESNDTTGTAQPLPASGWVSGTTSSTTDADFYSVALDAGDTIYLSLDLDPERDTTEWNGQLGFGSFGTPAQVLLANDPGSSTPDSEAFFFTVKSAGTYSILVGVPSGGTTFGTYTLSASVFSRANEGTCTNYASTDVPVTIPTGPAIVTSTVTVPGNPRVGHLRVNLNVTHNFMPDLDVQLTSPGGSTISLFSDVGSFTAGVQTTMDVTLDDDNAIPIGSFPVVQDIAPTPELNYRLGWMNGVDAGGTWTLTVRDDTANNAGTINSWSLDICEDAPQVCGSSTSTVFQTDFETDDGGFTHSGTQDEWEYGTPAYAPLTTANSGTKAWKTDLDNTYNANSSQELLSPQISLPATGVLTLTWAQKYQVESASFDHAYVEVREVGGAGAVRRLFEHLAATMFDSVGNPVVRVEESSGWSLCTHDISDFAGKNVQVVWHLDSDNTVQLAGLAVDDVKIEQCAAVTAADISVSVTNDSPDPGIAGGNVTYTFTALNNGPADAAAATVTAPLPVGTTFVSATTPAGWSATTPAVGASGTVTFVTTQTFANAGLAEFTVTVAVPCSAADASVLSFTATGSSANDSNAANDADTETTDVTNAAPTVASCPSNVSVPADTGLCTAVVTYTEPTATDDAGCTPTVSCSPASGSAFSVGVTTVTCTATDAANQTGTCSFTVTVNDAVAPVLSNCPVDATIVASSPLGQPHTYTEPTATDTCTGATVACSPASGSTFALGTTTVTCTATDGSSNTASCSFTVTVVQHDTVGVYIPSTNARFLRNTNTTGPADLSFGYGGSSTLVPLEGDWDDDGVDTPGLYDPAAGTFYLRNTNTPGAADITFAFGAPNGGYVPIAGDWDGDGFDSVGLYNPSTGAFFLKNTNSAGGADLSFFFGAPDAALVPVAGNWDGTGGDSVGVYNPTTSVFFLTNTNAAGGADLVFQFGQTGGGFTPITGDWNNDGTDTVGVYNPSTAGFFLTDTAPSITADYIFVYGPANATPIVGNWDGF